MLSRPDAINRRSCALLQVCLRTVEGDHCLSQSRKIMLIDNIQYNNKFKAEETVSTLPGRGGKRKQSIAATRFLMSQEPKNH